MFVLRRDSDGAFVAEPGQQYSYTKGMQFARMFATREQAEKEKCGNETIVPVRNHRVWG